MTVADIHSALRRMGDPYHNIYIPEFSYRGLRVDALLIDLHHRRCRGFEIKVSRTDFLSDRKWTEYSSFCSSLSIACPEGLVKPDEVQKPFGLIYFSDPPITDRLPGLCVRWVKRPGDFQRRASLAWFWTYLHVLETEFPRLAWENRRLEDELKISARRTP